MSGTTAPQVGDQPDGRMYKLPDPPDGEIKLDDYLAAEAVAEEPLTWVPTETQEERIERVKAMRAGADKCGMAAAQLLRAEAELRAVAKALLHAPSSEG